MLENRICSVFVTNRGSQSVQAGAMLCSRHSDLVKDESCQGELVRVECAYRIIDLPAGSTCTRVPTGLAPIA